MFIQLDNGNKSQMKKKDDTDKKKPKENWKL